MRPFVPAGPPRFAHQLAGLRKIIENRGVGALLYEPGTGKTAVALDYASLLALKAPAPRHEARVLVIAPLAAVDSWVSQSKVFVHEDVAVHAEALGGSIKQRAARLVTLGPASSSPTSRRKPERARPLATYDRPRTSDTQPLLTLVVVNLDTFSSRDAVTSTRTVADVVVDAVRDFAPDLVVVDESHRIKSATSNVSRALARLTKHAPRRILLTGTVWPHSPLDTYGQWRFLDPTALGYNGRPATWSGFQSKYAQMGGWMGKQVVGYQNLDELEKIMAKHAVVAKKTDVLDLPPVTDVTVPITLSPRESKAYEDMKTQLAAQLADGSLLAVPNRLAQMMRLRQITSGYLPDNAGQPQQLGSSKVAAIKSLVQDSLVGEKRVVVFSHFRHEIGQIAQALADRNTEVVTISGDTPPEERAAIRERFGPNGPQDQRIVMVAQLRTMSLAVNELVSASHAVFASLSQQRDDYEQARARLDRQGQLKPVTMWHVVVPGTVDEVILQSHRDRTDLEGAMLDYIRGGQ